MKKIFADIFKEVGNVFSSYFLVDMDIMSPQIRKIMANPEDRKIYLEAIKDLKKDEGQKEVTLTLSNKKKITLSMNH